MSRAIMGLGVAAILVLSSCKRGSCDGVECLNGGSCRGGRCQCPAGFGGSRCELKWSDGWVGSYTVDDQCKVVGMIPQYDATVTPSTVYPDVVYFEGFGDIRCEGQRIRVEVRLTGPNAATINRQTSCNRRYSIEGMITRDPNRRSLTVEYYYRDFETNISDTCRAIWLRY
ncbi:MAG: hypothetical protein N2253_02010 [Bacteroidia bacterium]|nr:hypothetical protein [Bacteroidia bacterium]